MAKSISVGQKRRGRPATGQTPQITARLPGELTERLDRWAAKHGALTRSDAIRQLLGQALAVPKPKGEGAEGPEDKAHQSEGISPTK